MHCLSIPPVLGNAAVINLALFLLCILVLPGLVLGLLRKVKARLQNRIGAPVWQPILDIVKLWRKDETVSSTCSWVFRFAAIFNVSAALYLAAVIPWLTPKPALGNADLFMMLYMVAGMRLSTLLAAMDSGSAFGAFSASREATLSFLVEPGAILSLVALAIAAQSTDLNVIFASPHSFGNPCLWLFSGLALLLAGLVDLSRMPIDDPTTHLELTMVHEALIIEASGKNLALFEYANTLKLSIFFGLSAQCFMRVIPVSELLANSTWPIATVAFSICSLVLVAASVAVFESVAVKLHWRKAPEFIAYSLTLAFMACLVALGAGIK